MEAWIEQLKNRVNTIKHLKALVTVSAQEEAALRAIDSRWGTTLYFASLMDKTNPNCPIRKQVIPSIAEVRALRSWDLSKKTLPPAFPGNSTPECIVQKYPDRVAFIVSDRCASYCRFCFRKELVMTKTKPLSLKVEEGIRWIRTAHHIRDVLITGGDPFILSDDRIEHLVRRLREIPHIEMIRFGTRTPIVFPQRITAPLCRILGGFHRVPIWVNTHCNHPKEITMHTARAIFKLLSSGVNVGNQAVLLRGINDDQDTLRRLHQKLLSIRIRPYYLFHCEMAPGNEAFRTPIALGKTLLTRALCGHTTGLARPIYAVDTEKGKQSTLSVALNVGL